MFCCVELVVDVVVAVFATKVWFEPKPTKRSAVIASASAQGLCFAMFHIIYHEKLIGKSALEEGDPPMGCAEGDFIAEEAFSDFRANIAPQPDDDPAINRWVGLSVHTERGVKVECLDTVLFEWNFGDHKELRVDVLGIPYPRYEELFPGRYAAYEASFSNDKS